MNKTTEENQNIWKKQPFNFYENLNDFNDIEDVLIRIKDIVENFDGVMNCHGIYINNDEKYISLDAVLNFSIKDKDIFREKITNTIKGEFPEYKINTK